MLQPTKQRLRLYDGTVVAPAGQIRLEVTNPKTMQRYNCEFIVVSGAAVSLIGAKTSLAMGLLKIEYQNIANADASVNENPVLTRDAVMERYHDMFSEEVGHLEGDLHLELDLQIAPVPTTCQKNSSGITRTSTGRVTGIRGKRCHRQSGCPDRLGVWDGGGAEEKWKAACLFRSETAE